MAIHIRKLTGKSHGGIKCARLFIVSATQRHTMGDCYDGKYLTPIVLTGSFTWDEINFQKDSAIFTEVFNQGATGDSYRSQIPFSIAKDEFQRINRVLKLHNDSWLVYFTGNNGLSKMIGRLDHGAGIKMVNRSGKSRLSERNEINCIIQYTGRKPVPQYDFDVP